MIHAVMLAWHSNISHYLIQLMKKNMFISHTETLFKNKTTDRLADGL